MLALTQGDTRVEVDASNGARLTQLTVAGRQLLLPHEEGGDPVLGGCFPMVPWAGRVRQGRFTFEGIAVQLELDAPPPALHGMAYRRSWTVDQTGAAQAELRIDLSTPAMVAAG
ncbi:MAG TPA: hypothetical protein VMM13_02080, partial [Euzebya sp.]|nr:hypothetical protein [Euzebya sp.]